jgi:hypothetical protein
VYMWGVYVGCMWGMDKSYEYNPQIDKLSQ